MVRASDLFAVGRLRLPPFLRSLPGWWCRERSSAHSSLRFRLSAHDSTRRPHSPAARAPARRGLSVIRSASPAGPCLAARSANGIRSQRGGRSRRLAPRRVAPCREHCRREKSYAAGYEKGRSDSAKQQYHTLIEQQRQPAGGNEEPATLFDIPLPEREFGGAILKPSTRTLRIQE